MILQDGGEYISCIGRYIIEKARRKFKKLSATCENIKTKGLILKDFNRDPE
tara:strand:+ start:1416 stop:1568 length:153 start_codon:yes stop_codon:yes gene_type:complete